MLSILATLQAGIFFLYAWYIYKRFGVLKSISTSSYHLPHNENWMFSVALFLTGILQFPIVIMYDLPTLLFYPALGLWYTGFTVNHRKGADMGIHYVGVISAIIVQYLIYIISFGLWTPAILAGIVAIVMWLFIDENLVWWVELEVMLFVWLGYMLI